MSKPQYKLSCILMSHNLDVRGLAVFNDGSFVSASRDKTAKLWKFVEGGYTQGPTMEGHTNFVSSVCVFNPSETYPKGLIVTGSNDNHICLYQTEDVEPLKKFKAHENTVCGLRTSVYEDNTFFSCSWDCSIKMWNLGDLDKPKTVYCGHTAAVWCVADLKSGLVLSGSADKFVFVWLRDGSIMHKLSGHTDCIRDISVINDHQFLSCANDASIRYWSSLDGTFIAELSGHENYIYSIDTNPSEKLLISAGEDQTVRIWWDGEVSQVLKLPVQSIWSLKLTPKKDIICGCSDGDIRVFTCDPERFADAETMQKFDEAVINFNSGTEKEFGGKKLEDIPDRTALLTPGRKDGDVRMIREGNTVKAYNWSQREMNWVVIGDVMGSNTNSAAKTFYNGMEYDYVFSVDIQDGVPPLKLPYNMCDDPWHVAQKFIEDNNLSQMFLEQVANFIIKNSQQSSQTPQSQPQFKDPFTGASRYIPGSSGSQNNFSAPPKSPEKPAVPTTSYIPMSTYVKLEQANLSAIHEKLKEFNAKQEMSSQNVCEEKLEFVVKLANNNESQQAVISGAITTLKILLDWPDNLLFPVLDVARLSVLHKNVNSKLCNEELFAAVKKHLQKDADPPNQMLTFRLLANMFHHEEGEKLCLSYAKEVLQAIEDLPTVGNKNNQIAMTTYILNLAVALTKAKHSQSNVELLNVIFKLINLIKESEAVFRVLVALGTLIVKFHKNDETEFVKHLRQSDETLNFLQTMSRKQTDNTQDKLVGVSKEIIDLLINS